MKRVLVNFILGGIAVQVAGLWGPVFVIVGATAEILISMTERLEREGQVHD